MSSNDRSKFASGHAAAALAVAAWLFAVQAGADEAPQSKHQMMKECMAKQKASESGKLKEDMRKSCKDLIGTEKQNSDKAAASDAQTPQK